MFHSNPEKAIKLISNVDINNHKCEHEINFYRSVKIVLNLRNSHQFSYGNEIVFGSENMG